MEGSRTYIWRVAVGVFLLYLVLGQTCDRYWLLHKEICYRHFTDQVSYLEAKRQCKSAHGRLVANLTDGLEDHLLDPTEQNENSSYWCKTDGDDSMFSLPGLQRRRRSTSCCFISNMEYRLGECDELRGYICEKDNTPLVHICLQNTTSGSHASDWESARRYCQCNGGDLYSFNDTAEKEKFLQFATERNQSMWIGLRREEHSKEFLWSDGTPLIYSIWDGVQPSTDDNSKLCVAYIHQNSTWEVVDCTSRMFFKCRPSENVNRFFYSDSTMETTPYDNSSEWTTVDSTPYNDSSAEATVETTFYNVSSAETETETETEWYAYHNESTVEMDLYNSSSEDSTLTSETTPQHTSILYDNTTTETDDYDIFTDASTLETTLTSVTIENATAEREYLSACSPMFENCYIAGVVVGLIILLTSTLVSVVYSRFRKSTDMNPEAPVELLNVHSYKEDIPAKILAAKIKEVMA